jgi:oligopeptide/dipeptide ABC transporter ATP-binding protein
MLGSNAPVLQVNHLSLAFRTPAGSADVVKDLSYTLKKGRVLGVVGESGSGKTMQALALLKLLPPNALITGGEVAYNGKNLLALTERELRDVRGNKIAFIFQDPMSSLNPVLTIGEQMTETLRAHKKITREEARKQCAQLLEKVGISGGEKRLNDYPFQFSGGMCQRVMIAMALLLHPDILIADEPTTALDVTIQAQMLRLIKTLQQENDMACLFITHNLAVVAGIADEVLVLYGGVCMELAPAEQIFANPLHPYTRGLLGSLAPLDKKVARLPAISGRPPLVGEKITGCPFAPRCAQATKKCFEVCPPLFAEDNRQTRCWLREQK